MAWYDHTQEDKEALAIQIARRRKRGEKFDPILPPEGRRKLVESFWAKAWCDHLEAHKDYEYRLPRGRSYLRQGRVYNLAIEPGVITAEVAGSALYEVRIQIRPLDPDHWQRLKADCAGQVASLLDLLGGKLGPGVLRAIANPEHGLFPKSHEIQFSCSCPDYADLCKHAAAVLYGVGVKLDTAPDLFFILRSVDPAELLSTTARETLQAAGDADQALAGEDLSALFGIDLPPPETAPPKVQRPPGKAQTASPKPTTPRRPARTLPPPERTNGSGKKAAPLSRRSRSGKKARP